MKLNIGCNLYKLPGWMNIDADATVNPDMVLTVPPLPFDTDSVEEIYCGHCLEHLTQANGHVLLQECLRVLVPHGKLGVVVPDMDVICKRFVTKEDSPLQIGHNVYNFIDIDAINTIFLYNDDKFPHRWSYTPESLERVMRTVGFINLSPIDRMGDPRLASGAFFQCGLDGYKP